MVTEDRASGLTLTQQAVLAAFHRVRRLDSAQPQTGPSASSARGAGRGRLISVAWPLQDVTPPPVASDGPWRVQHHTQREGNPMRFTIAAGLMALAAAGCGTAGHSAESAATAAPKGAAKPSTPAGPAPLGTAQIRTSGKVGLKVTVYHAQALRSHATFGMPSRRFFGIDIRVCVTKVDKSTLLGQTAWSVDYADDTTAQPIGEWWNGEFSQPLYPVEKRVVAGQCLRGWIMFTPLKGRAVRVTYAPDDAEPAFWRIP